ncbi:major facilitator superfamily domain-containing protein [Hyaloraphidium curvatum]|nr:major facilitator superfamily domain-containing protein [Hyaloraphidium curvatum]
MAGDSAPNGRRLSANDLRRALTFLGAVVSLLASGTGYLAGMWTVQYASRVGYTQLQMASVNAAGTVVSSILALPLGRLGDVLERPQPLLFFGGTAILCGYLLLGGTYLGTVAHVGPATSALYISLAATGKVATVHAALFTNVRNFRERLRGLATGVPVSAVGLSAFVFATIARTFFMVPVSKDGVAHGAAPEMKLDVGGFLVGIGVIAGLANAFGAATVHWVPLDPEDEKIGDEEQRPLLRGADRPEYTSADLAAARSTIEDDTSPPPARRIITSLSSWDTWLWLYAKLALSGSGSMFIANVGSVALALFPDGTLPENPDLQAVQAKAVAAISLGSCAGRVVAGMLYDGLFGAVGGRRTTLFLFLACWMAVLQAWFLGSLGSWTPGSLVVFAGLMGTAYGGIQMSGPVVNSELFGTSYQAENYGSVVFVEAIGNFAFNSLFGRVWDAARRGLPDGSPLIVCRGEGCLKRTFAVTVAMTAAAAASVAALRWRMVAADRRGVT